MYGCVYAYERYRSQYMMAMGKIIHGYGTLVSIALGRRSSAVINLSDHFNEKTTGTFVEVV